MFLFVVGVVRVLNDDVFVVAVVVDHRNLPLVKIGSVIDKILLLLLLLFMLLLLLLWIPETYLSSLVKIGSVTAEILMTLSSR